MINIEYTLMLKSPLRVATGIGAAGYLDNTVVRSRNGLAFVPGSTIKGKLRASVFKLARALGDSTHEPFFETSGCAQGMPGAPCLICRIFGAAQFSGELNFGNACLETRTARLLEQLDQEDQKKARLLDATLKPETAIQYERRIRTNIAIDRRTRVTLPDRLFTQETIGEAAVFQGKIQGMIPGLSSSFHEIGLLVAGLELIMHLGGGRGRGLGYCQFTDIAIEIDGQPKARQPLLESL